MPVMFAILLLAQFTPGPADVLRLEGRCTYSPALVEQAQGAVLVACGEALLTEDGIAFAARGFAPSVRFSGAWSGAELDLQHVTRRGNDEPDAARGTCRLEFREADISAIVCSAIAGPRSYLVNFIMPNI